MLRLPEPMLARPGPLPTGKGWRYELKLDGFRALVCTHGARPRVRSRRGWDMTSRVPELADCLPSNVQLDGELIAWGDDGNPDFHRLGRRVLHGDTSIPVTLMAFDVLALDGEPTLRLPYSERHALLEEVVIDGPPAQLEVVASFDDGPALCVFRHSCASMLFRNGLNAKQVQAWLGHHSPAFTLSVYVHLLADDLPTPTFRDDLGGNRGATQPTETARDGGISEGEEKAQNLGLARAV